MRYAENTSVPTERSRAEIETVLARYGAEEFGYRTSAAAAQIAFHACGRIVRFTLPLPSKDDYRKTPAGKRERSDADAYRAWEQACRQRWRALALCIKAKLEAVECGITTFEQEFLAHIVLPNQQDVYSWLRPQIAEAYDTKRMPPLLLESNVRARH